jgi:solute carrier family 8 (sodium/calcium exchanger)
LEGRDTQVKITILDDDKPGKIVFENARVRQAVNMNLCTVTVKRVEGSDGEISVKYRTINYESGVRSAVAGEDYTHTEGTLVFKQ